MEQPTLTHDAPAKPEGHVPGPPDPMQKQLEQLFEASQPKLVEAQPLPKPTKLSELHRLKLENASLKLLNIGQQFEKLAQEREKFSREFDALRQECVAVYGIDVATTRIAEDGTFGGPLLPQMAPPSLSTGKR